MKKLFRALLIIIVVGSALSFKNLGQGTVYCSDLCFLPSRVNYTVDESGTEFDPCENGFGGEYARDQFTGLCVALPWTTYYSQTSP
jgi:hypothetical protein